MFIEFKRPALRRMRKNRLFCLTQIKKINWIDPCEKHEEKKHSNDKKNKDIVVQEKKKIRILIHTDAEKSLILCHIMLEITLSIITLNKPILSRIST